MVAVDAAVAAVTASFACAAAPVPPPGRPGFSTSASAWALARIRSPSCCTDPKQFWNTLFVIEPRTTRPLQSSGCEPFQGEEAVYVIDWDAAPVYAVISFAGPSSDATGAFSKSSANSSCAGAGTPGTALADWCAGGEDGEADDHRRSETERFASFGPASGKARERALPHVGEGRHPSEASGRAWRRIPRSGLSWPDGAVQG